MWPIKLAGPAVIYIDADDIVYIVERNSGQVSVPTLKGERLAHGGAPCKKHEIFL